MGPTYDLLFETGRFNVTQPKEYYINECCYGEDTAAWLRDRLAELSIGVTEPEQEDWGWYVYVYYNEDRYFIGITGHSVDKSSGNRGEWALMVEKRRSLKEVITGKNRLVESEPIFDILKRLIEAQPDMMFLGILARRPGCGPDWRS